MTRARYLTAEEIAFEHKLHCDFFRHGECGNQDCKIRHSLPGKKYWFEFVGCVDYQTVKLIERLTDSDEVPKL